MHWNKKEVKEFSRLTSSLGISSIASANPALAVITLVSLAKAFADARQKGDYSQFVDGLAKGGVGTGMFLITPSLVGGPVWVGLLTAMCVGLAVQKVSDRVEISQVSDFLVSSIKANLPTQAEYSLQQ
jgi:hypothetical protein